MSTTLETSSSLQSLNTGGQTFLGLCSSVLVNAAAHPIHTIKNRRMANASTSIMALYRGYWAMCAVDTGAFATAYITNHALESRLSPLWASAFSGLLSVPATAIGEGLTANRQVHGMRYSQVLSRALRPAGLIATAARDTLFFPITFCGAPWLQRSLQKRFPRQISSPATIIAVQILSGATVGATIGYLTTPVDLIKTRVQTSSQPLSISQAVRNVITTSGWRGFFAGGKPRALYIAIAGGGMNVLNHSAPPYFPTAFHRSGWNV